MFYLEKEFSFEAAHRLPHHDGKCAKLHGHSWKGRVVISGTNLIQSGPKQGMLMDYGDLKAILHPIVEALDHSFLNDSTSLESPTSESIAMWIWNRISWAIQQHGVRLAAVVIDETCTSRCIYAGPEEEVQLPLPGVTC